jgi:hypothetical protein
MSDPKHIAERYIATWNETDPRKRSELLQLDWDGEASYVDPMARAVGREEIDGLIGGLQERFPSFRFALTGAPNGYGEFVRLSGSLGPPGAEAPIEGSDMIVIDGGRIARVIGFLDKIPNAA